MIGSWMTPDPGSQIWDRLIRSRIDRGCLVSGGLGFDIDRDVSARGEETILHSQAKSVETRAHKRSIGILRIGSAESHRPRPAYFAPVIGKFAGGIG